MSSLVKLTGIEYLFLVGGFAESAMLQAEIRKEFGQQVKIVIPQEASLAILKGMYAIHIAAWLTGYIHTFS